jgi:pimeloyl-ACP methyl ester carboxylesterase
MTVGMSDRSTYQELKSMVLDFIDHGLNGYGDAGTNSNRANTTSMQENRINKTEYISKNSAGIFWGLFGGSNGSSVPIESRRKASCRPIYLAGESFGGILAADVALTLLAGKQNSNYRNAPIENLQGLVLINPATCYDRSQLAIKGPQVSNMPKALYLMGLFGQLLPLFTDEYSVEQLGLILQAQALPSVIDNPQREAYMGRVAISLPTKLEFMPPDTLSWRLEQWLQTGCAIMRESSFKSFPKFRTLIVVGENDKTLPSIAEAERLTNKVMLPSQTQIHVVEGAGHASTCGSRLDLTAVMRKHFSELQKPPKTNSIKQPKGAADAGSTEREKRTSMKPAAQKGTGARFGMEERYDKARIGLNPILYWSRNIYRSVQSIVEVRRIFVPESNLEVSYKKTRYKVSM